MIVFYIFKLILTIKTADDIAYIALFQFKSGELYIGAFQFGTKIMKLFISIYYTSCIWVLVWLMDSTDIVKFEIHYG